MNSCTINGKLFSLGRRGLKVTDKGSIYGSINILIDEKTNTTVEVNFMPQSPTYKSGNENTTYELLNTILKTQPSVEKLGLKDAMMLRCDGDITTNPYFAAEKGKKSDGLKLSEPSQIRGSFLHEDDRVLPGANFTVVAWVKSMVAMDNDPDGGYRVNAELYDDYNGFYRPVSFVIRDALGISSLNNHIVDQPYVTTLSGILAEHSITREVEAAEMEFGSNVSTKTYSRLEYLITGATTPADTEFMTEDFLTAAKNNRAQFLLERKTYAEKHPKTSASGENNSSDSATSTKRKSTRDF